MDNTFILYIFLLIIILFLVMLAQRLKISYPIVLVLGGLLISLVPRLPEVKIDPEMVFFIFLPPLLYEAAWNTSWKEFWKWRRVIGSFAFLFVLLTSCIVAYVSHSLIPGFTLSLGFLLGGIISPPDAVSASSILKEIKVPKRMMAIIEGESLLNDASSLIVFKFALAAVVTGNFIFGEAALNFFVVIIMGTLTGIAIAMIFYTVHRYMPTTPSIDTVLTFLAPYIMYITAERFHFSGVLAVVSGGLFLSNRSHTMLSHLSRIRGANVWSTVGFVLNGLVFMLIGLELPVITGQLGVTSTWAAIGYSLIISFVLVVTRLISALGSSAWTTLISRFVKTADSRPGWRGPMIFGWTGMRGVVSLASALSIPILVRPGVPFPQRNLILFITFVVILVTLVGQGLTLPWMIRKMNMEEKDYPMTEHEMDIKVRAKLVKASLDLIETHYQPELLNNELLKSFKSRLQGDSTFLAHYEEHDNTGRPDETILRYQEITADILQNQRTLLHTINKKAEVDEDVIKKHLAILDLEEEKLRQQFE